MESPKSNRRQFVKRLGFGTAVSGLLGKSWLAPVVVEAQPIIFSGKGKLRVTLSDFPALSESFGSVRLGTSVVGADHFSTGLFPPVIITRGPTDQFFVVSASCTHEGCIVPSFPKQSGVTGFMECPCHGSRYLIDGTVIRGPAGFSLEKYPFQNQAGILDIQIPGDSFSQISLKPADATGNRVEFRFLAFANIEYELYSWDTINGSGKITRFSLTPDGAFTESSVFGRDDYITLYVPQAQFGFYEVAMKAKPV